MSEFDLDSFIAGINSDKQQSSGGNKNRLKKISMNRRDVQGTLTFVPVYSKTAGNFYVKLSGVYEYYGDTSLIDEGEGWFRVLPIEAYGQLTDDQIKLYTEVKGYLDFLRESGVSYEELRYRKYSLFYGIGLRMSTTEGGQFDEVVNSPCLFVYPSLSPINQLCEAINTKIEAMQGRKDWIPMILSTASKGRKGVVLIKFTSKPSGAGYDCSVSFEVNSEMNTIIDPNYEITEEMMSKFNDVIPAFLGWMYDRDNKSYFNETAFKELRDQLKLRIKSESEAEAAPEQAPITNQNDLTKDIKPKEAKLPF